MHQYQKVVKDFLIEYVIEMRESKSLTKTAMSVWLCIDPRSYFELERGRFSMSAASLLCFQCCLDDKEVLDMVHRFRGRLFSLTKRVG